jgi:hypothetical protein
VDTHFSSVPRGDRRHIDSSLGALISGVVLVGNFLGPPFSSSLASTPTGTVPSPIYLMLLLEDLSFSLLFILPPFRPSDLG